MKVGDYVRTEDGEIGIIIECPNGFEKNYGKWFWFDNQYVQRPLRREQIDKSSPNIFDLIEVGDYVNGYKVDDIRKDLIYCCEDNYEDYCLIVKKENIKSIATKEQFESIKYKIGEK